MKLNKFVILLGVVVVAGLAFIMSSEKASEKVTGVADDKKDESWICLPDNTWRSWLDICA